MLDIDFFKQYNDTYGHLVGDRILKPFAQPLNTISSNRTVLGAGVAKFVISLQSSGEQARRLRNDR
jgi:diguanylate cyclase (GGDEF)-like protein